MLETYIARRLSNRTGDTGLPVAVAAGFDQLVPVTVRFGTRSGRETLVQSPPRRNSDQTASSTPQE